MTTGPELDLEVVDVGVAYSLYMGTLVNLVIAFDQQDDLMAFGEEASVSAKRLESALLRCGVAKNIPAEFSGRDGAFALLEGQELQTEIADLLVKQHSRRQELIFIVASTLGGAIGAAATAGSPTARPLVQAALAAGRELGVSEKLVKECFSSQTLSPFRAFVSSEPWSPVVKAELGLWGFTIDIGKLVRRVNQWWRRRRAS